LRMRHRLRTAPNISPPYPEFKDGILGGCGEERFY